MPALSIDELMGDPDFATDTLAVMSSVESIGPNGRNQVNRSDPIPFIGTVHPAKARDLQRLPEGSVTQGAIVVITATPLTPGDTRSGRAADQVLWKGDLYVVAMLDDFSEWGAGFSVAICTYQALNT